MTAGRQINANSEYRERLREVASSYRHLGFSGVLGLSVAGAAGGNGAGPCMGPQSSPRVAWGRSCYNEGSKSKSMILVE